MTNTSQAEAILEPSEVKAPRVAEGGPLHIPRRWPDGTARLIIVAVGVILAWHTWARWGSIQIDCGRELYVPAEILRGKLLYRDLWYPFGPLEPYLAALLFWVFGKHFCVLYLFGLGLAIGSALLLFELGRLLEARMVGVVAALALLFQGFGPSTFNYVFPLDYASSLGMTLSFACALFVLRHILARESRSLIFAGLFAGMALLCKQEFGGACYILLVFVILMEAVSQRSIRTFLSEIALCAPGIVPALGVYGWFFWTLTPRFMVFDNWIWLPGTPFARSAGHVLYAKVGLRFAPREAVGLTLAAAEALLVWWLIARLGSRLPRKWAIVAGSFAAIGALAARQFALPLRAFILSLLFPPGLFSIGCGFLVYELYKLSREMDRRAVLAEAAFGVFALLLAARVLAQVVPYGYSIFYDGPLFLIFTIILTRCFAAAAGGLSIQATQWLKNLLLVVEVILLGICIIPGEGHRTAPLRTSWGIIYLMPAEARVAKQLLTFLAENKREGERVALLPELPMMYALTGTAAPSRWYILLPGYVTTDREQNYISDLRRNDVNYIIITNRNTSIYDVPYFGLDYNRRIYRWIERHYRVVGEFGDFERVHGAPLAALIYERRAQLPSAVKGDSGPA